VRHQAPHAHRLADPSLTVPPRPTAATLIDAVHRHYPPGISGDDPAHAAAPETARLRAAQERARADRSKLVAVMEAIEADVPGMQAMDTSYLSQDAGYTLRLNADPVAADTRRWREILACISIIAPVFLCYQETIVVDAAGLYRTTAADPRDSAVEPLWWVAARRIEEVFGHATIDPSLASVVVDDVHVQNVPLGEATLRDALFFPALG